MNTPPTLIGAGWAKPTRASQMIIGSEIKNSVATLKKAGVPVSIASNLPG